MGGKRGRSRCDMLPKIEKATVCRLKINGLKRKMCRLKKRKEYIDIYMLFTPSLFTSEVIRCHFMIYYIQRLYQAKSNPTK